MKLQVYEATTKKEEIVRLKLEDDGDTSYAYFKAPLETMRKEFDKYIGGGVPWTE